MQKHKKYLSAAAAVFVLSCCFSQTAFAISESDVQSQISSMGKEAAAGNVLIWFLCAVAFLKVSQKVDSFLSSLGIHVGHTGGSMLAEAMIAARGLGSIRNASSHYFGGGHSRSSTHVTPGGGTSGAGGFMAGGLAGVVSRSVTNSAVKSAVSSTNAAAPGKDSPGKRPGGLAGSLAGGIGGNLYAASVSKGGDFANNVIGSVAAGSIASIGSMSGEKAAEALTSYMGYAALEEGAEHVPVFSNVEIGGGRITGTETSEEYPEGISFGMYHTGQYTAPEGAYTTVHAADGASWYKQYAADAVEKSPYMAPDGSIAYKESIVKKLPPTPKRKDRI